MNDQPTILILSLKCWQKRFYVGPKSLNHKNCAEKLLGVKRTYKKILLQIGPYEDEILCAFSIVNNSLFSELFSAAARKMLLKA